MKTAACKAVAKLAISLKAIADANLANFSKKKTDISPLEFRQSFN